MPGSPPEDELTSAIVQLKKENPELGISKIHALLMNQYPDWTVSEKRTRKILQTQGLIVSAPGQALSILVYPSSRVVQGLNVQKWTSKVGVKWFDKRKGKGLIAMQEIKEGEVIWKEDPFIVAPEWEIFDLQIRSAACAFCTTPLGDSSLVVTCSASAPGSVCPARFCNRLCLARSAQVHPLLCPTKNPASVPLIKFVRESRWMALHALAHCTSRLLLANQADEKAFSEDWDVVWSLAELGMEERHKYSFNLSGQSEPDRESWKKAHQLFIQAFKEPKTTPDAKKLMKILKKPLRENIETDIFDYNTGFLRGLGRMSLNLEAHGGLYTLHSHLNHSCIPNCSVRHLDQHTALARITVIAKRDIHAGEELFVTYVNPEASYHARQSELQGWGFGTCNCPRCLEEVKMSKDKGADEGLTDLASELKAGLGVM
ncbi:SET domain-containing protein [Macrolepiota fuliginosa MF-IS2]|uniref:Histone-lysine N-methyltransferase SET5 n=1 Tax=Macrolepiota fuliginosa MF-IS2 TaxID=1400762 RepID=A0A9P5XHD6_9AGAR|nr:SET domain-containing protein [Macrolepiota fuliginosa MF-IS2]